MIRLVNLGKTHQNGAIRTSALVGINLEIEAGEFVAVCGPSGSGKSTLLGVLGMLDTADAGQYWFEGRNISGIGEAALSRLRRGRVGFIFQSFHLIEADTVSGNVALALRYLDLPAREKQRRVATTLERLDMAGLANRHPCQLSGGQQQRVAIARALVSEPALLLADEPTGNLDTVHGEEFMRMLRAVNGSGTTVLMATHSPTHAAQARRTVHLLDGRISADALHTH